MTIHPDDTYDGGRLCPDVTTKSGGHHFECSCYQCFPDDEQLTEQPSTDPDSGTQDEIDQEEVPW
jgi:hypothetical protein